MRLSFIVISSIVLLAAAGFFVHRFSAETKPPARIIILVIDTLRADFLTPYGASPQLTPALSRLAERSIVFERAVAAAPWTLPSISSIMTSLYPAFHQMTGRLAPWLAEAGESGKVSRLNDAIPTLGELLQGAGYRTYSSVNNPWINPVTGILKGVEQSRFTKSRKDRDVLAHGMEWYTSEDERVFTYLHMMEPHGPYECPSERVVPLMPLFSAFKRPLTDAEKSLDNPDSYLGKAGTWAPLELQHDVSFWRACYGSEVRRADTYIGEFLEQLERHPAWNDTVLIVTGDHGEELLDQGGWNHGGKLNAPILNIPLLIRLPGNKHAGLRVSETVSHVDILPTLLDLIAESGRLPEHAQGISLVPLIEGKRIESRPVFSSGSLNSPDAAAVFFEDKKLISADGGISPRLYSFIQDSMERNPLESPRTVADMQQILQEYQRKASRFARDAGAGELPNRQLKQLKALGYLN